MKPKTPMARSRKSAPTTPKTRSASVLVATLAAVSNNLFVLIESEENFALWEELLHTCEAEWYAHSEFTKDTSPCRNGDEMNVHADAGFRLGLAVGQRLQPGAFDAQGGVR